jgi:hypothetical protein
MNFTPFLPYKFSIFFLMAQSHADALGMYKETLGKRIKEYDVNRF